MANPLRSWVMLAALVVCVLLCWSSLADAYPPKPQAPGKNATKEDWEKYRLDLTRYVNLITRQRYGKRATVEQVLGRLLYGTDSSRDFEPRVDYSDEWNTSPGFP